MTDTTREPRTDWTDLANDIRRVDGNHDLGAGALAEALIERGWTKAAPDAALREAALAVYHGQLGFHYPRHPDILALGIVLFPARALATPPAEEKP